MYCNATAVICLDKHLLQPDKVAAWEKNVAMQAAFGHASYLTAS
jgi:hypothetical protein